MIHFNNFYSNWKKHSEFPRSLTLKSVSTKFSSRKILDAEFLESSSLRNFRSRIDLDSAVGAVLHNSILCIFLIFSVYVEFFYTSCACIGSSISYSALSMIFVALHKDMTLHFTLVILEGSLKATAGD